MYKLWKCACILLLCAVVPVFIGAQNAQKVVPIESAAYTYLDSIYRESGLSLPSSFKPYTVTEFREYVRLVHRNRLSREGRRVLELLEKMLEPDVLITENGWNDKQANVDSTKIAAFSTGARVAVEYYWKDEATGGYFFNRDDRAPMLEFPLELFLFDAFYGNATFTLQEDFRLSAGRWESITYAKDTTENLSYENHWNIFSLEANVLELDWTFPFRGLMSIGGPHWHLTYGRDSIDLGNGKSGNLLLSSFPGYYDTLILSTHWKLFKYTASYTYLEPWLTSEDKTDIESGEYFMRLHDYGLPYKALMLHHLELRPLINFDRLPQFTLFLSEAIMFGSQYPQLRDFNPFMIFHNWFEYERTNDSFLLGINVSPFPFLEAYYQFFLNEFDTEYEDGGNYPGAQGWMAGLIGTIPLTKGILTGYAEVAHTDPLLYNRYHPLIAFSSRKRIWSYIEPDQMMYINKPIGYFTGPDTLLITGSLSYWLPPVVEAELEYFYIEKGEKDLDSEYAETPGETTPTGIAEISHVIALHLEYSPLPVVSIGGSVYYVYDTNVDHAAGVIRDDLQFTMNVTLTLEKQAFVQTRRALRK
jgi:hypothetical protein